MKKAQRSSVKNQLVIFLNATVQAGDNIYAALSPARLSVCLSVRHTGGSVKNSCS